MIQVKIGNIFESNMDVLVDTINCVGVMGKGIAKTYKEKFPKMFDEYKDLCIHKKSKLVFYTHIMKMKKSKY